MKIYEKLYINGHWVAPAEPKMDDVVNPATEELCGRVAVAGHSDVDAAVRAARQAFEAWSQTRPEERARYITRIVETLSKRMEEMALTITAEMGAPLDFSRAVQAGDPLDALSRHADLTQLVDKEEVVGNATVIRESIGVCAFINPWNYPLHQMIGKVAPALAAGCTMVVKPSASTPLHAFLLAQVIDAAGLPAGVFNLLNGPGKEIGESLCRHPDVDLISFTGSTRAGVRVSQLAAPTVKRVCLELGGKSPFLICDDADLDAAVRLGVDDVMYNTGQTCTALTRMLVPNSCYDEAVAIAKSYAESLTVGDPLDESTFMGPMASAGQLEIVRNYINKGVEEGATLVTGGPEPVEGLQKGYYIRPTIFADVTNDMVIAREEIFGPVLCLIPYESESEAIDIANDSPFGLSARVWSSDKEKAKGIARKIRAGQVYINEGLWNNQSPFGGYKQSGNGREMGTHGVSEFFEIKALLD